MTAAKVIDQQRRWNRRLLILLFQFRTKLFIDGSLPFSEPFPAMTELRKKWKRENEPN